MRGIDKGRPGRPGDAVIVTGSGTGIGLETSLQLAAAGFRVFATVRNPDQRAELQAAASERGVELEVLRLDVTDRASIAEAVTAVLDAAGGIFALVNNAGIGLRGCTEDCAEDEIRQLFETNVLGTIAVTQAVIPHMREAGCGRIVTVTSVGGRVCGFGVTMYCATKFAQEGLGEGLAQELAPFGIQSVIVEPGIIETTRWSRHRGTAARAEDPDSAYYGLFRESEAIADKLVKRSPTRPADVARTITQALSAKQPRMRYVVGRGASIVIALRRHMPQGLFERLYFGGHIRRVERRAKAAVAPLQEQAQEQALPMSRVLFATWPFDGHLLPQLSIARAFAERGHGVAFYSGEAARASVEQAGFELFAFERVDEQRVFQTLHEIDGGGRRGRPGGGRLLPLMRRWLVETIDGQVEDLHQVLAQWPADAICADIALWGPPLVLWEAKPIPVALCSTLMGAAIPGADAPPLGFGMRPPRSRMARVGTAALTRLTELLALPLRRRVDEVRARYGLPGLGESVNRFSGRLPLYIVGNVREFDYDRRDLPASVHYVGRCAWYPRRPDSERPLETIPSRRPWVHVTESTLACDDPFLLRAAIAALAQEPVEVLIATGERRAATVLGDGALPANVHLARWLDHGDLLPRCSALVTLGGTSTVLAAAAAGVPMVLVPNNWEKPDNARRVTEAGAGIRLSARRVTQAGLRAAVREVIAEPSYREAAQRLAGQLAAAPGPVRAAELLEQLAGGAAQRRQSPAIVRRAA